MQPSLFQSAPVPWSVIELTRYLRDLLTSDANLQDIWVQGEISNFSRPSSGHWYFTIKDSNAALKCVMWRNISQQQDFAPHNGDAVEVHGAISVYEAGGVYQLYADNIRPLGTGRLYQEFLRLKDHLEAQGLFDENRKRPIPSWPQRIGIITSPTGAALRDMLNTLRRRYPLAEVILIPTPVQGNEAPAAIVKAFQSMAMNVHPDVILLARGGGSIEDLWAFNDETVAHAIAASPVPVISGVGHETDFTIADFVADLRAPTPTAAAELATPNQEELRTGLTELVKHLVHIMQAVLSTHRWQINIINNQLQFHSPKTRLQTEQQRIDELCHRAETAWLHNIRLHHSHLNSLEQQLASLNPFSILKRGFAIVSHQDGDVIQSTGQVHPEDLLDVRVNDGHFLVKVSE